VFLKKRKSPKAKKKEEEESKKKKKQVVSIMDVRSYYHVQTIQGLLQCTRYRWNSITPRCAGFLKRREHTGETLE
jgi:hypothetical protein